MSMIYLFTYFFLQLKRENVKACIGSHCLGRTRRWWAQTALALFPGLFHKRRFPNWNAASLGSWQSLLEEPGKILNCSWIPWRRGIQMPHLHPSLSMCRSPAWRLRKQDVINKWNEPTRANSPSLAPWNPGSISGKIDMLDRNDMVS